MGKIQKIKEIFEYKLNDKIVFYQIWKRVSDIFENSWNLNIEISELNVSRQGENELPWARFLYKINVNDSNSAKKLQP